MCPAPGGSAGAAVSQSAQMEREIAPADRKAKSLCCFLRGEKVRPGCVLLEDSPPGAKGAAGAGQHRGQRWHQGGSERRDGSPSLGIVCPARRCEAAENSKNTSYSSLPAQKVYFL